MADEIVKTINSSNGRNIGTGLQIDLEEAMAKIIPSEIGYTFEFNMSGFTRNIFYEKNNPNNFIII
jgi:hypothetical protein